MTTTRDTAASRRRRIVAIARERGAIDVADLSAQLALAPATLRRDLRALEADGLVRRSYGMVYAVETTRYETSLALRAASDSEERSAIARAAAEAIGEATTVYVDEGRTTLLAAAQLPKERPLTVVTPSLPVAAELASGTPHEVLLLGGRVRGRTLGTVDYWARDMLSEFVIDVALLGANGVALDEGLTTPDPAVAAIKSMAVRVSKRRIVACEHTKFGVNSFARFARIADIDLFVTGGRLSPTLTRRMTQRGAQFLQV
ncbi:DeoR/GlpR family DNA-binding transcription regulator [Microbacterium betulae]|uniref:Lactose phosphotransferase system repressor n=1 Tax=Microbacterium betulae TaxID=2981139 RepID=A0AA97FHF7_9MICO|nr:DeoR/GlpR family DNA-binding transcription regulator [Microbacterium sp. AB]WOF22743.1 DeoR/GlpR family DNA-binding transcription regulator [Microbacterium sp. AB]